MQFFYRLITLFLSQTLFSTDLLQRKKNSCEFINFWKFCGNTDISKWLHIGKYYRNLEKWQINISLHCFCRGFLRERFYELVKNCSHENIANGILGRVTFFNFHSVLSHTLALVMMLASVSMGQFQFFSEVFPVQ